jgi:Methyltransferase domain
MARNALLIWFSFWAVLPAFAQGPSARDDWRKPDQLIRALALKRSDVVVEPEAFLAPLISDRVRSLVKIDDAPEHSVDVVMLYDVLHGIDHRSQFYPKLRRVLRFGGHVVNVDFSENPPSSGPPEPKLSDAQAAQEFTAAGFHITKTVSFLRFQYFQVLE